MRRICGGLLAMALLLFAAAGCGRTYACHVGARSPERAVATLLEAAAESNEELACTVVDNEPPPDDVDAELATIRDFVSRAGGVENLSVEEDWDQRMGSLGLVVVRAADSTAFMTFEVIQSGGRHTVVLGDTKAGLGDPPYSPPAPPSHTPAPVP